MAEYEDYRQNSTGQSELHKDFRLDTGSEKLAFTPPSALPRGQLWEDPDFSIHDAIQGKAYAEAQQRGLEWKHPTEIRKNPQLFTAGRSRYDVGQGEAGTCWFLATVSTIADKQLLLDRVIPPGTYSLGTPAYDGKFQARFWEFGKWEDVYIDDRLPVIHGDVIWSAHNPVDKEEMWISLLEKAFAKHHGSYNAVDGGNAKSAFMALTGGMAEYIVHREVRNRDQFFARINNAINSGCHVVSSVPGQFHDVHGLIGNHAYSMHGTATVRGEKLLRLRNPWGNEKEWTGPWSDKSYTWSGVPQSEVPHVDRDEGEFWISLTDFMTFFVDTTIGSLTPDFDEDGRTDTLDYVANIYGQWSGRNAAGFRNKLGNPKYAFTLPDSDVDVPVVVQLIQKRRHRNDETEQIRCDLFKLQGSDGQRGVLENMGLDTNSYTNDAQHCFRFRLKGGIYCLVPSTADPGIEREFLIRVFSPVPLGNVREMDKIKVLAYKLQPSLHHIGIEYPLSFCKTEFGSWKSGVNAGGQISHKSHHTNPQYHISLTQSDTALVLRVLQDMNSVLPIGIQLFEVTPGESLPLKYEQIRTKYNSGNKIIPTTDGAAFKFIRGSDFDATYLLNRGDYLLLAHSNTPAEEGEFTLVFKSSDEIQIKGYQSGA